MEISIEEPCGRRRCDQDTIKAAPKSEESATAKLRCDDENCSWEETRHWRQVIPYRVTGLDWIRAKRRHRRAERAGDIQAADRIAERMLRVNRREAVLEAFRGE